MEPNTKTVEKCPKCHVTNPTSIAKCRNCGEELPWADSVPETKTGPGGMPLGKGAADAKQFKGMSVHDAIKAEEEAKAARAAGTPVPVANSTSASGAPQIYDGPPPGERGARSEEEKPKKSKAPLAIGGVIGALAVLFLGMRMIAVPAAEPVKPEDWAVHTSGDKQFQCLAPKSWETTTASGDNGVKGGSTFKQGSAFIQISTDAKGSFMSEAMRTSPDGKTKVQQLFEADALEFMPTKYPEYEEETTTTQKIMGPMGETWYTVFTGKGGFREGQLKGIRATMLAQDMRIRYIATCREADWDKMQGDYLKVLNSISPPGSPLSITGATTLPGGANIPGQPLAPGAAPPPMGAPGAPPMGAPPVPSQPGMPAPGASPVAVPPPPMPVAPGQPPVPVSPQNS